MKPNDLDPRSGKVLRYVVYRNRHGEEYVKASDCIVKISWSDLPHSLMQAASALDWLAKHGLVQRLKKGFVSTPAGRNLIDKADKARMWNTPPPRSVTNARKGKQ